MPILNREDNIGDYRIPLPETVRKVEPEGRDLFSAAFEQTQFLPDLIANTQFKNDFDPEYDFMDDIKGTQYEQFSDSFAEVYNAGRADLVKARIDREIQNSQTIADNGVGGYAVLLGTGLLDPINLIPFAGPSVKIGKTGSVLRTTAKMAATGAALTAASEIPLTAIKETQTAGDAVTGIAAGTVLFGVVGGVAAKLADRAQFDSIAKQMDEDLNRPIDAYEALHLAEKESIGAAKTGTTLQQETLIPAKGMEKIPLTPALRLARSPNLEARKAVQNLTEFSPEFNKIEEGIASPQSAETLVSQATGKFAKGIEEHQKVYNEYRKATKELGAKPLKPSEFNEEVGKAMFNKDTSVDPHIAKTAANYRKVLFDPLKKEAIEVGLLPKNIKPQDADSYFSVVYNRQKVAANEGKFKEIVAEHIRGDTENILKNIDKETAARAKKLDIELAALKTEKMTNQLRMRIGKLESEKIKIPEEADTLKQLMKTTDYADDVAQEIAETIKGYDDFMQPLGMEIKSRGPLKEKVFHIPTNKITDFLDTDVARVSERYSQVMGREIALKRTFGSTSFKDFMIPIRENYQQIAAKIPDGPKKMAFDKLRKKEEADLQFLFDKVRGTYRSTNNPDSLISRAANTAKTLNFLRLMGGVLLSSIPDIANIVMRHGFTAPVRDFLIPRISAMNSLKLVKAEGQLAGQVIESITNARVAAFFDLESVYARGSKFERGMQNMTKTFSKMTFMNWWNDSMKLVVTSVTQAKILRSGETLLQGGKIPKRDMRALLSLGIDENSLRQIAVQSRKYGKKQDGLRIANSESWDNADVARKFRAALTKEGNSTIITPGSGDKPTLMSKELGGLITQFKGFAFATHQRVLIPALQRGQSEGYMAQGMAAMMLMGMLTYAIKEKAAGRKLSDNPAKWIFEGVDRSGIASVLMEGHNMTEKLTGVGMNRFMDTDGASRYSSRSTAEALLGPSLGLVLNASQIANNVGKGEFSESDLRGVRRMVPFQNLFYLRYLIDQGESGVAEGLGLDKRRVAKDR
jgi:hypothetical protein